MNKAEEIYHKFINYEWNQISEPLKNNIIKAIDEALKESEIMPELPNNLNQNHISDIFFKKGWEACWKKYKEK